MRSSASARGRWRASQWTRVSASVSANLQRDFEAAGNNRHLHIRPRGRPTHALRTMESPEKPPGKRQRKGNAPEPPQEDPDFTHCCIYNVSHADLTVWLCGRGQKDPRDAIPDGLGFGFLDSKIDIGPNKDGIFMKAKGGRVMLQRSLCRPKFSSQVRSPQTSQKNKQDLTTRPAHSRPIARRGKSPRPWRWVMVSPVMIDGYHGGQRRMRISNTVIYPGHHTLTSAVVSRWASRLASSMTTSTVTTSIGTQSLHPSTPRNCVRLRHTE